MSRELKHAGTFRDDNGQDWEIGVYQQDGQMRFETVVQGPDGQQYAPEEDFLGEFHLIDGEGRAHDAKLPMNMDALQEAVERVEDVAWGRKAPEQMQAEGKLNANERAQWEQIVEGYDKPAAKPEAQQQADTAGEKTGWRDRIKQMKENISQGRGV